MCKRLHERDTPRIARDLQMTYEHIKKTLRNLLRSHGLLLMILASYVAFQWVFVMRLPVVGIHAWNESIYLTFVNYMVKSGNPIAFRAAYDPFRPDYNVGYLFFWGAYLFQTGIKGFFTQSIEIFLLASRIFSLTATMISSVLIYVIANKLSKRLYCAYVAVVAFLFSPVVLYFGTKFQLEPFTFAVFLLSWLLIVMYRETDKLRYAIFGFLMLGALITTRQIFAVYVPALFLTFAKTGELLENRNGKLKLTLVLLSLISGFLGPLLLTQLLVPEDVPFEFQFSRLAQAPVLATSTPWQSGNIVSLYFTTSLLPSLGLSFLLIPILIAILPSLRRNRIEVIAFLLGGFGYFVFAFLHNIVHMYHGYYFLPMVLLSFIFVSATALEKRRRIVVVLTILLILFSIFSMWETISFYGVGSDNIYRKIDGYGNLDSVFAGYFINKIYHNSIKAELMDSRVTYYSLVQSPAVYFYEEMPSISYLDFFSWNTTIQKYEGFNFYVDQETFLQALKKRDLFILAITPDVYQKQNQSFRQYVRDEFVFIGSEGVFSFHLNRTIFNRAPAFYKSSALLTLVELESSQIAPDSVSKSLLNMSNWYKISQRSPAFGNQVLNGASGIYGIDSGQINNGSLSLEISMIPKAPQKMMTITSFDDIVNVKYGNSEDIYLEITSTANGYRWISGVDMSRFYWQNLTLTFVYDVDAKRAEIYMNGVLLSNSLNGVSDNSFSPISLPLNHFIRYASSSDFVELHSIRFWNHALNASEITQPGMSPQPIFTLP
jgi:4-amino-4-deoxy-L-arabinose transferase-like glycosyltransferase